MLKMIPAALVTTAASQPQSSGRPLSQSLALWLLRWWASQCRHAERPGRSVPYY